MLVALSCLSAADWLSGPAAMKHDAFRSAQLLPFPIGAGSVALDSSVSSQDSGLAMEQLAAMIDCIFRYASQLQGARKIRLRPAPLCLMPPACVRPPHCCCIYVQACKGSALYCAVIGKASFSGPTCWISPAMR
jgi:hypothetical protein